VFIKKSSKSKVAMFFTMVLIGAAAAYAYSQSSAFSRSVNEAKTTAHNLAGTSKASFRMDQPRTVLSPMPIKSGIGSVAIANNAGINYEADTDRGWFDIQFNNLPVLTDARFATTGVANVYSATAASVSSAAATTSSPLRVAAEAFVSASGQLRAYAQVRPSSSSATAEVLITDSLGATVCYAVATLGATAICDTTFTVTDCPGGGCSKIYNVYGSNSANTATSLVLRAGIMDPVDQAALISGPTKAAANSIVKARYTHNLRLTPRNIEQITMLKVYGSPGNLVREFPVFAKWNGLVSASTHPLQNGTGIENDFAFSYADRSELNNVIINVPVNATSVSFIAAQRNFSGLLAKPVEDVDLYLIAPFGANANPVIQAGNIAAATQVAASTNGNPSNTETIAVTNPAPGRWQMIARTKSGLPTNINMRATFNSFSAAPDFKFGHYYNPSRAGHGLYLDTVAGQWVLIWYAYLEDGTPTWYYAQAAAPTSAGGGSLWQAPLSRVVWNGSIQYKYSVGFVNIALLSDSSFQFNYIVNGETGNETFVRLGAPGCSQSAGQNFDVSGLWYSPSKPGFGYSIEPISNQEFSLSYLFDVAGYPRWLFAQKSFVDGTDSLVLKQQSGFCPLCTYVTPTRQDVGQLSRTITPTAGPDNAPGYGNISIAANFAAPLQGSWNESLPVELLTSRKGCR
jgi:hypothetical protein